MLMRSPTFGSCAGAAAGGAAIGAGFAGGAGEAAAGAFHPAAGVCGVAFIPAQGSWAIAAW